VVVDVGADGPAAEPPYIPGEVAAAEARDAETSGTVDPAIVEACAAARAAAAAIPSAEVEGPLGVCVESRVFSAAEFGGSAGEETSCIDAPGEANKSESCSCSDNANEIA
jgi:hypothetical protein